MPVIRSKFRVRDFTDHLGSTKVVMIPVNPKNQYDPEGSEENARFWRATPSGEVQLAFNHPPATLYDAATNETYAQHFRPGRCFYLDIEPGVAVEGDVWTVTAEVGGWYFNLKLHPHRRAGEVRLGIDNPAAVLLVLPSVFEGETKKQEWRLANPDSRDEVPQMPWRVSLAPAE